MQFSKSMIFAAVALVAPLAMNASSITSTSSLSLGGLTFSNFSCSISSDGGASSTPNTCKQINVGTITVPANGIQFSSSFEATAGAFEDATLGYSVTSVSGITNVGLDFNGYFEGLGVSSVTEQIFNGSDLIASLTVNCGNAGCTAADESQNIVLGGSYTSLNIQKDIAVNSNSTDTGNYAGLSIVDQTFTTTPGTNAAATPEPASLALVGAGLLAAGAIRRKMVKA